jgi:hypothetical protein
VNALRITFGVIAALAAIFAGGCSLLFGVGFLVDGDQYGLIMIPALGLSAAAGLGWVAWLLLRKRPGATEPPATPPEEPGL